MKKILLTILLALSTAGIAYAQSPGVLPAWQGGTTVNFWKNGSVPIGSGSTLATSTGLQFSTTSLLLTVTNATTTNLTALKFWLIGTSDGCATWTGDQLTSTGIACGSGSSSWATTSTDYWLTTKSTSDLTEGSNLYWTNNRFDTRLAATTTLPNITTLLGLTDTITTRLTTTNSTSTNLFATTASSTQQYVSLGIAIGTSTAPNRSIVLQKEDGSDFFIAARGTASGWVRDSFSSALYTRTTNGGFQVHGDTIQDGAGKISQFMFPHQNQSAGAVCSVRGTSISGNNSMVLGAGSSACKAIEYLYVLNSGGTGSTTAGNLAVQALQIDPLGQIIFGPGPTNPGYRLTVVGDSLLFGSTLAYKFTATSTTEASIFPLITNTGITSNRATTTNATTTNFAATNATTTNLFSGLGLSVATTSNPSRSIILQKEDASNALELWRGVSNFSLSMAGGVPSLISNSGSFVFGPDLTNGTDKITRLRTWGYNTTLPECTITSDSRAASSITIFGGVSTACFGTTEFRFANASSTGSTYQETTATLNNTGLAIGSLSPSARLTVGGDSLVTATSTAAVFTASASNSTSTLPLLTATRINIGSDYITDLTGSGLSVVGGALTATGGSNFLTNSGSNTYLNTGSNLQSPTLEATSTTATSTLPLLSVNALSLNGIYATSLWSTTSSNYLINSSTTIAKTGQASVFTANQTFNGGLTLDGYMGVLGAINGVVTSTSTPTVATIIATSTIATSTLPNLAITNLAVGSDYITDLTGANLSVVNGALTATLDGAFSTTSADYWESTQTRWATTSDSYAFDTRLAATTTLNNITTLGSLSLPLTQTTGTLSVARGGTGQTAFTQGWLSSDGVTLTSSTSPTVNYITATSSATSTFTGGLQVNGGTLTVDATNNLVGIGTLAPAARLNVALSDVTTTVPAFSVASSTNTAFIISNSNSNIGIGTTSLIRSKVSITSDAAIPAITVAGGASGVDLLRFYRPSAFGGTGQGLGLLVSGGNAQFSFRTGLDAASSGTTRNTFMYDTAGNGLSISTSTTAGVLTGLEAFYLKNATGNIGLSGTTTPWGSVSINGVLQEAGEPTFVVGSSTKTDLIVTQGGEVGVGTTSPWRKLSIVGTVAVNGLTTAAGTPNSVCINATTKEVTENAALTCTVSDRHQKSDIEPLTIDGLKTIMKLQPVSFEYNDNLDRSRWGFIAQDLQAVDSRLGDAYRDGEARSIDQPAIMSVVVKALQELNNKVDAKIPSESKEDAKWPYVLAIGLLGAWNLALTFRKK